MGLPCPRALQVHSPTASDVHQAGEIALRGNRGGGRGGVGGGARHGHEEGGQDDRQGETGNRAHGLTLLGLRPRSFLGAGWCGGSGGSLGGWHGRTQSGDRRGGDRGAACAQPPAAREVAAGKGTGGGRASK